MMVSDDEINIDINFDDSQVIHLTDDEISLLKTGNPEHIVDIKISSIGAQETELIKNGYTHLLPVDIQTQTSGSFGKGRSLWSRKRKNGTFSGRLRPITEIQLLNVSTSSAMVLSGYSCVTEPLGNQWVWIKRASSIEEEKDALLDLCVTHGKSKILSDKIWASPGVGWVRVDGNFGGGGIMEFGKIDSFLWFLPNRTRSPEVLALSPLRSAVVLNEDVRRERILVYVRNAIRVYIPVQEMQHMVRPQSTVNGVSRPSADLYQNSAVKNFDSTGRSTLFQRNALDHTNKFSGPIALYRKYDPSGKSHMTKSRFAAMLEDIGIRIESADITWCFYCFNVNMDKYISLEEFADTVRLTDHELDLTVEKMRQRILNVASGGLMTRNKLRDNRMLSKVFHYINVSETGIMSVEELMEFSSNVEQYLTYEEAKSILKLFDTNGNQRVEESEFIEYLKRSDVVFTRKAERVQDASTKLRIWLLRGTGAHVGISGAMSPSRSRFTAAADSTLNGTGFSVTLTPAQFQWAELKRRREKSIGNKFPGFICSEDLLLLLVTLGVRLSATEARELLLLIAPNRNAWQNGKIEQKDLISFANNSCRMLGQLDAVVERDLLKPLLDAYKENRHITRSTGEVSAMHADKYEGILQEIMEEVTGIDDAASVEHIRDSIDGAVGHFNDPTSPVRFSLTSVCSPASPSPRILRGAVKPSNMRDIYSLVQLKTGVERAMAAYIPAGVMLPSLEEWAMISCRLGAAVVDSEVYGVRIPLVFELLCAHLAGPLNDFHLGEKASLEPLCRDLKVLITDEANRAAGNGKNPDYEAVFRFFDTNSDSRISAEEFKNTLSRWKLLGNLSDTHVEQLISLFDRNNKGFIDLSDFINFLDADSKYADDIHEENDVDDIEVDNGMQIFGLGNNTPPVAITRNIDCDWLLWLMWREAVKRDSSDPECVIAELDQKCCNSRLATHQGTIRMSDLWKFIVETKLKGNVTKSQFAKCVLYIVDEARPLEGKQIADDDDLVDFDSLCRYVIRMGRSYNNMVSERKINDDRTYKELLPILKRELAVMMSVNSPAQAHIVSVNADKKNSPMKRHLKRAFQNDGAAQPQNAPRFQSVLCRLDQDNDGRVSCSEFKLAMKRLGCQNEPLWTLRLLRRFFEEVEPNSRNIKDNLKGASKGLLSIQKLVQFVRNVVNYDKILELDGPDLRQTNYLKTTLASTESMDGSIVDGDEGSEFLERRKSVADQKLFKKVSLSLQDVVDKVEPGVHIEDAVRASIRRFFLKTDVKGHGVVPEERFIAFIRNSGLEGDLSSAEVTRLVQKLRRSTNSAGVVMIDYEKLCSLINLPKESIPRGRSEAVVRRLAIAASKSARGGKSFLALCALVDPRGIGTITNEEFKLTAKMMDCPLSNADFEALAEALPLPASSRLSGSIDYKLLNSILQHQGIGSETHNRNSNKQRLLSGSFDDEGSTWDSIDSLSSVQDILNSSGQSFTSTAIPTLTNGRLTLGASSQPNTNGAALFSSMNPRLDNSAQQRQQNAIGYQSHPPMNFQLGSSAWQSRGTALAAPVNSSNQRHHQLLNSSLNHTDIFERTVSLVADRIQRVIRERSSLWGTNFSFRRLFEQYDPSLTGSVPLHRFQAILDDQSIALSPAEVQAISAMYARRDDFNQIDYECFCRDVIDNYGFNGVGSVPAQIHQSTSPPAFNIGVGNGSSAQQSMLLHTKQLTETPQQSATQSARVINRLQALRREGIDVFRSFAAYDTHNTGLIDMRFFRDVVQRLHLVQSEHQLQQIITQFVSLNDRSLVAYEDYCSSLELGEPSFRPGQISSHAAPPRIIDGSGFDGLRINSTNCSTTQKPSLQASKDHRQLLEDEIAYLQQQRDAEQLSPEDESSIRSRSRLGNSQRPRVRDVDNLTRFRDNLLGRTQSSGRPEDLEVGSESSDIFEPTYNSARSRSQSRNKSAQPLKIDTSLSRISVQSDRDPRGSWDSNHWDAAVSAVPKFQPLSSPPRSRMSPTRVGSMMWGKSTPLKYKGKPPAVPDCWCCAVCLYMENPLHSRSCAVCDAPNYGERKDFQLQEQCLNCAFPNGQFATECEMCGRTLALAQSQPRQAPKATRSRSPSNNKSCRERQLKGRPVEAEWKD